MTLAEHIFALMMAPYVCISDHEIVLIAEKARRAAEIWRETMPPPPQLPVPSAGDMGR